MDLKQILYNNMDQFVYSCFVFFMESGVMTVDYGIAEVDTTRILDVDDKVIVLGDKMTKQLLMVDTGDLSRVERNRTLDLSSAGNRWEGDVLNDGPFGWGVLFNEEGRMVYEGFRIGEVNVCYGRSYYADSGVVEYEGEWCGGLRCGRGIQYDRSGAVVFEGEWMNDKHLERSIYLSPDNEVLHSRIEELTVKSHCCNSEEWKELDFRGLGSLQQLRIGCNCFNHVTSVIIMDLENLASVHIGSECFRKGSLAAGKTNNHFHLKNCPKIRELVIKEYAFAYYSVCEIEDVPSLEVISIGERRLCCSGCCFNWSSLELKSALIHEEL